MPKGSVELTAARKEEIVAACAELYKTMSFKEITIKEIGAVTSFTRTSIYNYFHTKEEIFLALLKKEYEYWVESLKEIYTKNEKMSRIDLASAFAHSLEKRENMLKLLSMNLYDIEGNSRMDQLVDFKKSFGKSMEEVRNCLNKLCTDMSIEDKQNFIFEFFPFIYGIYPYTVVTKKQHEAMLQAGIDYVYMSIYEITFNCLKKLLEV